MIRKRVGSYISVDRKEALKKNWPAIMEMTRPGVILPSGTMKIRCAYDNLVKLSDLKPHPKNRNVHHLDQIERLSKILEYQGWRYPIKVSNLSGFVTSGHGRIMAAELNKWESVPVNYQDYDNEEMEYADVQADNAISSWAELSFSGINSDLENLGPDFDLEMLGIKDFELEPADKPEKPKKEKCPTCGK